MREYRYQHIEQNTGRVDPLHHRIFDPVADKLSFGTFWRASEYAVQAQFPYLWWNNRCYVASIRIMHDTGLQRNEK